MRKLYEVVFYSGEEPFPAYYLIDEFECETFEGELKNRLTQITQRVRKMFHIEDDISNWQIHKYLYVLQEDGITSISKITV